MCRKVGTVKPGRTEPVWRRRKDGAARKRAARGTPARQQQQARSGVMRMRRELRVASGSRKRAAGGRKVAAVRVVILFRAVRGVAAQASMRER